MIGKVPKAGRGFRGLINYLLYGDQSRELATMLARSNLASDKRVAWCEMRNVLLKDPDMVPNLMRATAMKSKRVKSPVYHYVISWHPDEAPSDDFMKQVADVTCGDLGLSEHQMIYVAHRDTDHHHVHIVVNRVHPETGVAWNRRQDWVRIEQSLRRQSEALGLDIVPGRHTDPEQFKTAPIRMNDGDRRQRQKRPSEAPTRQWSKDTIKERRAAIAEVVEKSSSWGQLSRALDAMGYQLMRKGQGLVVSDGEAAMKLSDVGKQVRIRFLEERFGQAFDEHATLSAEPDLVGGTTAAPVASPPPVQAKVVDPRSPQKPPQHRPKDRNPKEEAKRRRLAEKFDTLADAKGAADITEALATLGLASKQDVTRSRSDIAKAAEELNQEKSVIDQLTANIKIPGTATRAPVNPPDESVDAAKHHKTTPPKTEEPRPRQRRRRR